MLVNEPVLIRTVVFWRLELATSVKNLGFPNDSSGKEPVAMQEIWVRKIHQRRAGQHTPGFLPGKSYAQKSQRAVVHGVAKSVIQLSD